MKSLHTCFLKWKLLESWPFRFIVYKEEGSVYKAHSKQTGMVGPKIIVLFHLNIIYI